MKVPDDLVPVDRVRIVVAATDAGRRLLTSILDALTFKKENAA